MIRPSITILIKLSLLLSLVAAPVWSPGPALGERPSLPSYCPPLPPATGTIITVTALQNAVNNLTSNTTILIAPGDYPLDNTLVFDGGLTNVALRSQTGDRDSVTIRGKGMTNANYGNVPHGLLVRNADNLLIADLTIRDAYYHNIQIQGE